jgi:hypothetical protein
MRILISTEGKPDRERKRLGNIEEEDFKDKHNGN